MLCAGWEVVAADVEKTYLSTIFGHFWSWMSRYNDLWVICVRSWGWRALWVMSRDGWTISFAHDMLFGWKEGLWRLRSRNLFFGFFFIFGHGWVVVVAHEVTAWDCYSKGHHG
jgi:hypothetical protein